MSDNARLILGDALDILPTLEAGSVDAVITDPPYSSGGMFRGDRTADTDSKYTQTEYAGKRPNFSGDNMDQRSWTLWCFWWLSACRRVCRDGAHVLVFSDWRQLPALTDAVQAGGFVWRGIAVWDKGLASRAPGRGRFKHQCEYIVWASSGQLPSSEDAHFGHLPGCLQVPVLQEDKHHQAGKPTDVMRWLVKCCPPGGTVLDPFAGSGTTGVACLMEGRRFVGVELAPAYHAVAQRRLDAFEAGPPLFAQPQLFDAEDRTA